MQLVEKVESISDAGTESMAESAGRVEAEMRAAVLDSTSIESSAGDDDAQSTFPGRLKNSS